MIEADILVRNPLADYLRECGYHVLEACSAYEARQHLSHAEQKIDAVLCDADLPDESGFSFAHWLRREHSDTTVILAGTIEKEVEKAGELCEEGPAVSKPYNHQFVLDHIRRMLAARERN